MNLADLRRRIRDEFGYDEADDEAAARLLASHLRGDTWPALEDRAGDVERAAVIGCGPALGDIEEVPSGFLIACDGATTRLRELGAVPDVVVTDLDGPSEDLLWASLAGAHTVIHAHGDNHDAIEEMAAMFPGPVAGTHQCHPARIPPLRDIGGFTDGDRGVLLAAALGIRDVRLIAFEPDAGPGPYSHHYDPATKPAKLAWAKRIVDDAVGRGLIRLV